MPGPVPPPTHAEMRLRAILRAHSIPFTVGRRVWYTTIHYFTPDFVIGTNMIVEVEGSVHDQPWVFARDRIRKKALGVLGFTVLVVKNHDLAEPSKVADRIIQRYYETTEVVRQVNAIQFHPDGWREPEFYSNGKVRAIAQRVAPDLSREDWDLGSTIELLDKVGPKLTLNQYALDRIMLNCFGINLILRDSPFGRVIDFKSTFVLFGRSMKVMTSLFGPKGTVGMRNLLNVSAPKFFKNLVFKGGPNVNTGIIRVNSVEALKSQVGDFNNCFNEVGISVEESDVIAEAQETIKRMGRVPSELRWISLGELDRTPLPTN